MAFRKIPATETAGATRSTPAVTASWTHGSVLRARVGGIVLAGAVLCGPIALLWAGYSAYTAPPVVTAAPATPGFTAAQQDAGAYAISYVSAWFGATDQDSSAVAAFTNTQQASFPKDPVQYKDLTVASISAASQGIVHVVISASVAPSTDTAAAAVWSRRYYTVDVDVAKDPVLTAVGLPAPTGGPTAGKDGVQVGYPTSVDTAGPAAQTVQSFLQAYLAGQGDINVVVSPGTVIKPIHPTPYRSVQVQSISANTAIPAHPSDGTTVRVLIQTQLLGNGDEDRTSATYLLRLRARADRWEISGFDTYPVLSR